MAEDWSFGDPFSDPEDPQAAAREKRRLRTRGQAPRARGQGRRGGRGRRARSLPAAGPRAPGGAPQPRGGLLGRGPGAVRGGRDGDAGRGRRARGRQAAPRRAAARGAAVPAARLRLPRGASTPPAAGSSRPSSGSLCSGSWSPSSSPSTATATAASSVTIPKGASVSEVGDILDEKGVVSSSTLFQIRATIAGKRSDLYPGRFVLAADMSYGAALDALSKAPVKKVATVTIPEG